MSTRFTRNPGALRHGSGSLPICVTNDSAFLSVASLVVTAVDDLDERQARDRIEEVQAHETLRRAQASDSCSSPMLDVFVATSAVPSKLRLEVAKQRALGVRVLDDRFDHDIGRTDLLRFEIHRQAAAGRRRLRPAP